MRRSAEIAHSAMRGALHALHAARDAARETHTLATHLTIAPDEARAIHDAALLHLRQLEQLVTHADAAMQSAQDLNHAVDRAEITRFGLPVLKPATGA